MYVVKAKNAADNGWTTIYDSSDKALCLISQPKHSSEMNQPGSFDFTIYPDSDFYDSVTPMDTFISAFEGSDAEHLEETFYGRVLTCEDDFYGVKNVGCEGVLSFLKDATVGHVSTDENDSGQEYQTTPQAFLQEQLAAYNAKVEDRKKILYGSTSGITTSGAEIFKIDDDQDFRSVLESQLIDVYGGFFKITRQQNGTHVLSYVKNYGINAGTAQRIQIGQNVLDKQKHMTGEGVFTFIRPVGKDGVRLDDGVYHGVTCNSSNGRSGLYPVGTDAASFNALYARYGFIEKTKSFDDCETSAALANACNSYVRDYGLDALDKLPMTFDVKLVDFFNANPSVKRIELGTNYILTVDSEGRETGFEGHSDGTPAQAGQEGLTLTVYSISRDYENPENDGITLYNATYLTAKDYSVILSSMTGSYSGSSGGGSYRGGLSGLMASRDAEEQEEQNEERRKVEKRFIDDEDSIGMVITITEDGKVINAGGIWTEITGTDKTLLQGTLDVDLVALRSGAVITAINNNEADGTSLTIDFDRLNIKSGAVITAINDNEADGTNLTIDFDRLNITGGTLINVINGDDPSTTGDLTINAEKIDINGNVIVGTMPDGTAGAFKTALANITTRLFSPYVNARDLLTTNGTLRIGSSDGTQGGESGQLFFRGDEYFETVMYMGARTGPGNILIKNILSQDNSGAFSLNHYHDITATEGTGSNAGKILFTLGAPRSTEGTTNFNIAATQFYIDTLAAFEMALGDAGWSGYHATLIGASLDTTNKCLTVHNAVADVQLPGQSSTTRYSIGLGNLDLTTPLTNYYDEARAQGQEDHTAVSISDIFLDSGDAGYTVVKYPYVRYRNGDASSSIAIAVDCTAISGGSGEASSNIDLANSGEIWLHSADPGSNYVNLGSLGDRITEGKNNGSAYVSFQATCDGGATYKYYKIPL